MSHRNRKSRNKSAQKNAVTGSGGVSSISSEEISRNSSRLSSDSTSVQSDFSDFFDDIKNSFHSASSSDTEAAFSEVSDSVPENDIAETDDSVVFPAEPVPVASAEVPEDSISESQVSSPAAFAGDPSIDFSSFSWKDDLYQAVGYAPEQETSAASDNSAEASVGDTSPVSPVETPSVSHAEPDSSFHPLSSALSYDDEPGLAVPQSPRFLSFVENTADDTLFESAASVQEDFPVSSLEDIIAELSGTSASSSDSTDESSSADAESIPDPVMEDIEEDTEDSADNPDSSGYEVTYTLADILAEASGNRYVSADDIRSAISGNPYSAPAEKSSRASEKPAPSVTSSSEISAEQEDLSFDFDRDFDSLREELSGIPSDSPSPVLSSVASSGSDYTLNSILSGIDNLSPDEGPQIDSRFNLSGETDNTIRFGGVQVDLSADPSYNPHVQEEAYKSGYQEGKVPKESSGQFGFLNGFLGRRDSSKMAEVRAALSEKKVQETLASGEEEISAPDTGSVAFDSIDPVPEYDFSYTPDPSAFDSFSDSVSAEETSASASVDDIINSLKDGRMVSPAASAKSDESSDSGTVEPDAPAEGYLNDTDYDYSDPDGDDFESSSEGVDYFPSTFREYILTGITAFLYKLRPGARAGSSTVEDKTENLGQEVSPAKASRYYGSFSTSLRNRLRLSIILLVIMAYISIGLPCTGMLKTKTGATEFCLAAQLTIMMLSLDIVTAGIMDIVRRKPGAASLAVVSCIFTSLDALISAVGKTGTLHMPLCALSSLSLVGILFASLLHSRGMRKALRVPAISKRAYTVTGEMNVKQREITLLKSVRPSVGFVRRSEEAAPDEEFFQKASPFILILAVLLGIILAVAEKSFSDLIYYISAVFAASVPFTALIAYALPFYLGSVSIFSSGAAIAGWSGLSDIGRSKNLVVTDRDLFPDGSVDFESIRIFADEDTEKVISYAGTMVAASGSCLSVPFADLMTRNNCRPCRVEHFEYLSGGGMKGIIEGDVVIFGNSDMLRLMNVRVPFRLVSKTTTLLAINGVLYGIFDMKYTATPSVRDALIKLIRSDRHPIFAIRDFNITPGLLHDIYDLATDGYDFPPYIERYRISAAEPSEDSKIAAVVCREGLGPLTHLADTGHSMYRSVVANCIITAACSVIGMLAMFISVLAAGSVSVKGFFLFMVISALPVFFISVFMKD